MCEEKESAELSRLRESFWENPSETDLQGPDVHVGIDEEAEEEEWEKEVRSSLESLRDVGVEEGYVLYCRRIYSG